MSSKPSDDDLKDKAGDRDDEVRKTVDNLKDVGDSIGDAEDLAGNARDYDAKITGILGTLLDNDTSTFSYTAEALSNFGNVMSSHVSSLAGLHDKVDRNRREFLVITTAGAAGFVDYSNILPGDSDFSGHFNEDPQDYPNGDIDAFGLIGDQPERLSTGLGAVDYSVSDPSQVRGYLEDDVIGNPEKEQEWEALVSQNYNPDTGEFFPGEDIDFESLDVVYDDGPGQDSAYRVTSELDGQSQKDEWIPFEHDETAEDVLEYFGEL